MSEANDPIPAPESQSAPASDLPTTPPAESAGDINAGETGKPETPAAPETSDIPKPPPTSDKAAGKIKKEKKPPEKGRWRKRILRGLAIAIAAAIAFQAVLIYSLPWTLRKLARSANLDFSCERVELELLSGDTGLWHVRISQLDKNGQPLTHRDDKGNTVSNDPIATMEYCRGDISPLQLLRGRLVVQRVEADGVELTLQRDADGSFPLLRDLLESNKPKAKEPGKPLKIDLNPPVAIDALRLTNIKTHIIDMVSPGLNKEVEMNLRLSDLASSERPMKLMVELVPDPRSAPLLDSMVFEAESPSRKLPTDPVDLTFRFSALGLHPKALAGYLTPFGVHSLTEGLAVRASGEVTASVLPGAGDTVSASVKLDDMSLVADGKDALTLHSLSLAIDSAGPAGVKVGNLLLSDGTFVAQRTKTGFSVAGLEYSPGSEPASPTAAPAKDKVEATPAVAAQSSGGAPSSAVTTPAIPVSLNEFSLKNFRAVFTDSAVAPAANLQFAINALTLKGVDTAQPDKPIVMTGNFAAPGVASGVNIDGVFRPLAAKKTFELKVKVDGVKPDAVRPYLDMIGVQSDLKGGVLTCDLIADIATPADHMLTANARLKNLLWVDGDTEMLALDEVNIGGVGMDMRTAPGTIRVNSIEMTGPRGAARRDASGTLEAMGFKHATVAAPPVVSGRTPPKKKSDHSESNKAITPPAAPTDVLASLPRIEIGHLLWKGVHFSVDDEMSAPGVALAIEDGGVELKEVHVDFNPKAPPSAPGTFRAWLKAPGIAGNIEANGTVTQLPTGVAADVELSAKGLSADLATPLLKAINIEPTLQSGSFHAKAHAQIEHDGASILATVAASEVKFADGDEELFGVDRAAITGVHLNPGSLEIDEIALDKPRGKIARDADGSLRAGGIHLLNKPPEAPKAKFAAAAPTSQPTTEPSTQPTGDTVAGAPATQPSPLDVIVLKKLTITDGALAWSDKQVTPAADITGRASGEISGLVWGKPADPAKISFHLKADGIVDDITLAGTASASPTAASVILDTTATGVKQGALASYLPPGKTIELHDGRFTSKLEAGFAVDATGKMSGKLAITGVDFRDGADGAPLFKMDQALVDVGLIDPPTEKNPGAITIKEISVKGAEARASIGPDGSTHAFGLAIAPATQPAAAEAPKAAAVPAGEHPLVASAIVAPDGAAAPAAGAPPGAVVPAAPPAVAPPSTKPAVLAGPIKFEKHVYPLITIEKLDVNLDRFTLTNESQKDAAPLVVSKLRLFSHLPLVALGDDPRLPPPLNLGISLSVEKVIDLITVDTKVAPFASPITVEADVNGTGMHGDGLIDLLPALKPKISGAELTDGRFHTHFEASAKISRLDPTTFPMDDPFDAEFDLKDVNFRATPDGPVLAGVGEVHGDGIHINPRSGDVRCKLIDVNNVVARAILEKDGLHAMGLIVQVEEPPTTQPTTKPAVEEPTTRPAVPPTQPVDSSPEFSITRLTVSGMDVLIEDRTVTPPLIMPITQFDLDAQGLSSKAMTEAGHTAKFSLLIGAGKISVPRRLDKNFLAGGLKDAAALLGGKRVNTAVVMEKRDLFSQIQADGKLSLYPENNGWLKATVSGFDLASMTGEAKTRGGVSLTQGAFDSNIIAKMPGDGSANIDSHFTVTDLDLQEGPDGPISRYLHLPAPLNIVIGALTDSDGSIDVPIVVPVPKGSKAGIAGPAVDAFGKIVATALANAPVKGLNAATGAASAIVSVVPGGSALTDFATKLIPGLAPKVEDNSPIVIGFLLGDDSPQLSAAPQARLDNIIARMKADANIELTLRSDVSGGPDAANGDLDEMTGDVGRARDRSNPSEDDARAMINRLTLRKQDLIRRRAELLGIARGQTASFPPAAAAASLDRLHSAERDLAATEEALDRLSDLLRPGAENQKGRRTKQAALILANARNMAVKKFIRAAGIADSRIQTPNAQFNPTRSGQNEGGVVTVTITIKKKV